MFRLLAGKPSSPVVAGRRRCRSSLGIGADDVYAGVVDGATEHEADADGVTVVAVLVDEFLHGVADVFEGADGVTVGGGSGEVGVGVSDIIGLGHGFGADANRGTGDGLVRGISRAVEAFADYGEGEDGVIAVGRYGVRVKLAAGGLDVASDGAAEASEGVACGIARKETTNHRARP